MPSKKNLKKTKKNTTRKQKRHTRKKVRKIRKGGADCGCNSNAKFPFILGGQYSNPATFDSQNVHSSSEGGKFYPLNSYNMSGSSVIDPTDANISMSSRNVPNFSLYGGKRTRKGKVGKKMKMKKQKGGFIFPDFLGPASGNMVHSFGSSFGLSDTNQLFHSGTINVNGNPLVQPISNPNSQGAII